MAIEVFLLNIRQIVGLLGKTASTGEMWLKIDIFYHLSFLLEWFLLSFLSNLFWYSFCL